MESQLYDSSTVPAQEFAESFFSRVPTDSRFLQTSFQKIMPNSSIDADIIEFNFERYSAANLYMIQDTYMEINLLITKSDGSLPDKSKKVGLVNNILHSMFESVRLYINDTLISISPKHYPYKAYIGTVLTFSPHSKNAQAKNKQFFFNLTTWLLKGVDLGVDLIL
jgi:hypothetical protein